MRSASRTIKQMGRSGIREVFDLARTIPDAIHLEMGEPDFATPQHIIEAAHRAALGGHTKYTPNAGIPELREALADKFRTRNRLEAEPDRITVTPGAIAALSGAFLALCDRGDQVLLPDPGWPNYRMIAEMQGLDAVAYPLRFGRGFIPSVDDIEELITPRTKVILLNSPNNPTGSVADAGTLNSVLDLAAAHGIWVISDEVYDEIFFDGPVAPSAAAQGHGDRVVTVCSFSKTYAMTGWRIGYALAPDSVSHLLTKTQEPTTACVNAPAQLAALEAISGSQDCVTSMVEEYKKRRNTVASILTRAGVPHLTPAGAFYVWIDVGSATTDSSDFARRLLLDAHVAVTPGSAFGETSDTFVRVSLATKPDLLIEGIERLVRTMDRIQM